MEEENKTEGIPVIPPDNPHLDIGEFEGKKAIVIGAGMQHSTAVIEAAIRMAKEKGINIIVGDGKDLQKKEYIPSLDDLAIPILKRISELPLPIIHDINDPDTPNKLQMLRDLKLSPKQIDYFQNAPPQRLEGETQEDYKTRRMLNKLIIKYRGEF